MDQLLGKSLGRYRLDTLLGEGGMGAVFKAHDVTLQRNVAVKIMHPQFARVGNFRERFLQEARTAARLNHPGIVQVHDFGQEKELLFIVMEFIPGANLQQMLNQLREQKQWLPLNEAVELLRQVALALDYVHGHGVLHRDIKPANVMLKPEPDEDLPYRPVLTDLGLAKLLEGESLTQEGTSMGTPPYMSPEQAMGEKVDARSDVYSLGILLYELAVGKLPFPIKSLTEAIRYHVKEPPPPPRTLRPDLPVLLEKIILKALAKNPEERIPDAAELAKGLKSIAPQISQAASTPTLLESSVSLVTQYQQSLLEPRGVSILHEFDEVSDLSEDRIQVFAEGKTTITVAFKRSGMVIGRDKSCDISLDDTMASRNHARIELVDGHYKVTDLGSTNGTYFENVKILPGVSEEWTPEKPLRIGNTYLRLVLAADQGSMAGSAAAPIQQVRGQVKPQAQTLDPARLHNSVIGGRATLYVPQTRFKVDPGGSVAIPISLLNQGNVVDHFRITADGFPPSWLQGQPPIVQLMPGSHQDVMLTLQPPLSSRSRAGDYPITLRAVSQDNSQDVAEAKIILTVGAFHRFTSDFHPQRIRAGHAARVTIQNQGNQPQTYKLTWRDRGEELVFTPPNAQVTVTEGQSASAEFTARPRQRKWSAGEQTFQFNIQVQAPTGETQPHNGEMVSRGRLPAWLVPVLMGLCLLLAGGVGIGSYIAYQSTVQATTTAQAVAGMQTNAVQTVLAQTTLDADATQVVINAAAVSATQQAGTAAADATQSAATAAAESTMKAATAQAAGDDDNDGLSNSQELALGTLPNDPDTDKDNLPDGAEVNQFGTNPKLLDSDGDTIMDGKEVNELHTSPMNKDTDGDGVQDNVDTDPLHLPTPTPAMPPEGISMNCDGTFQRFRTDDFGSSGQVIYLENWDGSNWHTVWQFDSGDPMVRNIDLGTAGFYKFGDCQQVLIIPLYYTGSGSIFELNVYAWDGSTAVSILQVADATQGYWWIEGDSIFVNYSVYLYGEPTCCPCNRQTNVYDWVEDRFEPGATSLEPTYSGDPPSECQAQITLVPIFPRLLLTPLPIFRP